MSQEAPRERARRILRQHFGRNPGHPLLAEDVAWLEGERHPWEATLLDTLQRLGGDRYDWRAERSWDARARHFSSLI